MFPIMGATNPTGYNLTRSLRTRASASAYLSKAAYGSGGGITTWASWIKRGTLGVTNQILFTSTDRSDYYDWFGFNSSDQLVYWHRYNNSDATFSTSAVFRDPSAWYFIQVVIDSTQASNANRVKIYVNGTQQTLTVSGTFTQNQGIRVFSSSSATNICGTSAYITSNYFDGYLAEINLIDGQALTPSSFGSTNTLTGVWQPARYTGTYGTNGFYLPFTDNSALTTSSNVGLGKDFSGNGNYWTTNNISITSGTTYDSMTDVPTLTSATAANFAVLNPLDKYSSITVSGGNLDAICADVAWRSGAMTFGNFTTGKWYYEVTATNIGGSTYISAGWELASFNHTAQTGGVGAATGNNFGVLISTNLRQTKVNSSIFSSDSNANANGDVLMIAVDFDAGKGWVGKNGTWYDSGNPSAGTNPCTTTVSGGMTPAYQMYNNGGLSANFGQRPFTYTPPTGFVALNTYNLPTSTIVKGNTVMDATLYTGNGSTNAITNAAGFKPDFVWGKSRSLAQQHLLFDSVRGVGNYLQSQSTAAEGFDANTLTSFNSNGFTLGSNITINTNASTNVAWQWQAGQGTTSSNTNGTITSTVSVNASAGFSVVTYTGAGAARTVGHGLGVAPTFYIVKSRNPATPSVDGYWVVYSSVLGAGTALLLNTTNASNPSGGWWNSTAPTSSVFSVGTDTNTNASGTNFVAYCWTPIAGYSAFGSYTGNGSTDGTFVYVGFRPRYILLKRTDSAIAWIVYDTARNTYNVTNSVLQPNVSTAEVTAVDIDVLSNGFKLRTTDAAGNASGGTYIYACFAENPLKFALAR